MIKLEEKQSIILKYIRDGKSQRQIQRETGIARETIRKYTKIYETKLKELGVADDEFSKAVLIADLVTAPKYKSSPRTKSTMTDEIIERLSKDVP